MFKVMDINDIQNMIIRNKLEDIIRITELELVDVNNSYRYTLFFKNKIVNSFEIYEDTCKLDEIAAYHYMLGFIDLYTILHK